MHTSKPSRRISISSSTIFRTVVILALCGLIFYIRDIILVLLTAVVIASSVEPVTLWAAKYRIGRLPAVVIMYVGIVAIMAVFFIFFLPSLLSELTVYINSLPQNISLSDLWSPIRDSVIIGDTGALTTPISTMSTNMVGTAGAGMNAGINAGVGSGLGSQSVSVTQIVDTIKSFISGTGEGAFKTASTIFGGALSLVLIVVLSFYLAVQQDGVSEFLKIITPVKHHEYVVSLWKRSQRKIGYWMQGQLLLGVIIGIFVYLGLLILGVKHALLLASIAVIFELIPVFGPILSAIPAVIIGIVDGGATLGLFVAGYYLVIHQFENHLLYPLVVKKIVGISPILVIISLVVGAKLAGFLGILLSVPVAAVIMEFVTDIQKERDNTATPLPLVGQ